jgi:hypothetical protein
MVEKDFGSRNELLRGCAEAAEPDKSAQMMAMEETGRMSQRRGY